MNAKKYIFILIVAVFAVAAISAFGAESKVNISTNSEAAATGPDLSEPIARLNNPSRAVAAGAVKDLALMHTEEATQALIRYIKTSKDDYMRIQVIEVLAVNPSMSTMPAFIEAARDHNPYVRMAAIKSLGFRPEADSLTELKRALSQDTHNGVKKFALQSLSLHKSSAAVEAVDSVLADKKSNRDMRAMAAHALKRINTQASRSKLDKYKNDTDIAVRNEANQVQTVSQTKPNKGK